jgi:hypothetical protein
MSPSFCPARNLPGCASTMVTSQPARARHHPTATPIPPAPRMCTGRVNLLRLVLRVIEDGIDPKRTAARRIFSRVSNASLVLFEHRNRSPLETCVGQSELVSVTPTWNNPLSALSRRRCSLRTLRRCSSRLRSCALSQISRTPSPISGSNGCSLPDRARAEVSLPDPEPDPSSGVPSSSTRGRCPPEVCTWKD